MFSAWLLVYSINCSVMEVECCGGVRSPVFGALLLTFRVEFWVWEIGARSSLFGVRGLLFVVCCYAFGVRCWACPVFGAWLLAFGVELWVLEIGARSSLFGARSSLFVVRCLLFDVVHSVFGVRCWACGLRCFVLGFERRDLGDQFCVLIVRCSVLIFGCWLLRYWCSLLGVGS